MAKNIATTIDAFVDSVKALNTYTLTTRKKLSGMRATIKDAAFDVFDAGGKWKDCEKALSECGEEFKTETLEKYFINWKDARDKAEGKTPRKKNPGRQDPNAEPANKAYQSTLPSGHPTTMAEAIDAGVAFARPYVETSIEKSHSKANPCFTTSSNPLDQQIALANAQHATVNGFRNASGNIGRQGESNSKLAATMRTDLETTNPKEPKETKRATKPKVAA